MKTPPVPKKPLALLSVTEAVVKLAYFLDQSKTYKRIKHLCFNFLENSDSRVKAWFDLGMIVLVLTSIFLLMYEVKNPQWTFIANFEIFVVSVFIIEYLLRLWVYNNVHQIVISHDEHAQYTGTRVRLGSVVKEALSKKWEYMTTPLAIIDLLAILPSYRPLRILRIFLLFRLFKLFRYARSVNEFSRVLLERRFEFYTLAIFLSFVVFAASTAIYIFEGDGGNPDIENFFDAIYWALVTISTVGYGDITPATTEGRVITLVLIMAGIGVIAFSTSIVVAAFTEKLRDLRENRIYAELERFESYIIICGFGRVGEVVAEMLKHDKENLLVIDNDPERVEAAKASGLLAIQGDAGESQLMHKIESKRKASMVLCLTTDDVTNVYITLTARKLHKDIKIISRANKEESIKKLELAGADHVITPYEVVGLVASESIGQAVAFEAIYGILTGHKYFTIETVGWPEIKTKVPFTISQLETDRFKVLVLGVIVENTDENNTRQDSYQLKKQRFIFNPDNRFELNKAHLLVLFGHQYSIAHFRDKLATAKVKGGVFTL